MTLDESWGKTLHSFSFEKRSHVTTLGRVLLPTLADRVWFAYHCLPYDETGALPSHARLERAYGLSGGTFSKTIHGVRTEHMRGTLPKMAEALRVSASWLDEGIGRAPTLPHDRFLPPRPGGNGWLRYGDVPGWDEAVREARVNPDLEGLIPEEAYLAGADFPIVRHVATMTPELATWVSGHAYETCTAAQQTRYATRAAKEASGAPPRARALRRREAK